MPAHEHVAVVLVGGKGTRLRPLTERVPKPMLPLLGKPLFSYTLDWLAGGGVSRAVLACGYLPEHVSSHYGPSHAGIRLEYVLEHQALGTGGAIALGARGLEDSFVALNGDTVREADLRALMEFHRRKRAQATILLVRVPDPARYGLVRVAEDGRVRGFLEKPRPEEIDTDLVNAGAYVLEPEALDSIEPGRPTSIETEVFPVLAERGTLYGLQLPGYWLDIGTPASYLEAHVDLLERRGGAGISEDAEISADARLVPPLVAAEGAVVEAGARVGPHVYLGTGARVREDATLEQAVALPDAVIAAGASIRSAIVSPDGVLATTDERHGVERHGVERHRVERHGVAA